MTYLPDLHSYLHQSSLLIQAYPSARITTKYSLPRRPSGNPNSKRSQKAAAAISATSEATAQPAATSGKEKREPAATLTLKTYHADTGLCLKYRTDKAQEVGRLLNGLGRLAKGEVIEMPSATSASAAAGDKMEVDGQPAVGAEGIVKDGKTDAAMEKSAAQMTQPQGQQQQQSGGGGKKKKKSGKK